MKKSQQRQAEVDLGEAGILVLSFRKVLTKAQRENVNSVMRAIAANPGRQTIVLEDGCKYSVIPREKSE